MNDTVFFFFYNLAHQSIFLDKMIVFLADTFPYIVAVGAGIFLFYKHFKIKEFIFVFLSSFFAYAIASILKILIHTPRPFLVFSDVQSLFIENSFAFPSGHAAFFSCLAMTIFFINKKVGYYFMFFAFLIGITRIASGVHFPVDILGGFAIGIAISFVFKYIFEKPLFFGIFTENLTK